MDPALGGVLTLLGALWGAAIGSFLAVVADRVPRGESLGGRSRCVCGRPIPARDNVPILGYLALRGRARCCGAPIPRRYLWFEVGGALVGAAIVGVVSLIA